MISDKTHCSSSCGRQESKYLCEWLYETSGLLKGRFDGIYFCKQTSRYKSSTGTVRTVSSDLFRDEIRENRTFLNLKQIEICSQ